MLGAEFAVSKVTLDLFVGQIYRMPAAFVIVAHSSPVTHNDRDVVLELFDMYVFYTGNQGHSNEIVLSPFTRQVK